jgi:hypothetical protein
VSALEDIAAERSRQINAEGWTPEHDDEHIDGELATAAACYALSTTWLENFARKYWPWDMDWFKPKNPRRDLVRAAALIVAEIERRDRDAERGK